MHKKDTRILAIDPGTKEMGVAFFDNCELIYYSVKVISAQKTPHERLKEAREIVLRLIRDFKPRVIVVEKTYFANGRNKSLINVLVDDINAIGKRRKLKVIPYASNTVRKHICGNGHAGKKELAKAIIIRYPELKVYLTQDRAWKERFHQNMFDAVALGIMAMEHRN